MYGNFAQWTFNYLYIPPMNLPTYHLPYSPLLYPCGLFPLCLLVYSFCLVGFSSYLPPGLPAALPFPLYALHYLLYADPHPHSSSLQPGTARLRDITPCDLPYPLCLHCNTYLFGQCNLPGLYGPYYRFYLPLFWLVSHIRCTRVFLYSLLFGTLLLLCMPCEPAFTATFVTLCLGWLFDTTDRFPTGCLCLPFLICLYYYFTTGQYPCIPGRAHAALAQRQQPAVPDQPLLPCKQTLPPLACPMPHFPGYSPSPDGDDACPFPIPTPSPCTLQYYTPTSGHAFLPAAFVDCLVWTTTRSI